MKSDNLLNQIRKQQGLKLKDVSAKSGLSIGYLGVIFSAKLRVIPESTKRKLAAALGVSKKVIS